MLLLLNMWPLEGTKIMGTAFQNDGNLEERDVYYNKDSTICCKVINTLNPLSTLAYIHNFRGKKNWLQWIMFFKVPWIQISWLHTAAELLRGKHNELMCMITFAEDIFFIINSLHFNQLFKFWKLVLQFIKPLFSPSNIFWVLLSSSINFIHSQAAIIFPLNFSCLRVSKVV